jgi:hypothetical protein
VFVRQQFSVRSNEGVVLRESKQGWHERVTLFATLSLSDDVRLARVVCPAKTRLLAVEHLYPGQQRLQTFH